MPFSFSRFLKLLVLLILLSGGVLFWLREDRAPRDFQQKSGVLVRDGENEYALDSQSALSIGEFLLQAGFGLSPEDAVFPAPELPLTSGIRIQIRRSHEFRLAVDERQETRKSLAATVDEALAEAGVVLDDDDIVAPPRQAAVSQGMAIKVTRVEITEEVQEKSLAFQTETREDSELSWRKKIVTTKGEKGIERSVYRVSRHDGREVNRKLLERTVTKEPVTEVVTQGTYVKTGKSHSGGASWYAHTGTLAAANPWLPFGSYVRVTNKENGKSVIVKINDRGPFGAGRIIDLDKVAFQEIASLGTGVIDVKMEEIVN